MFAYSSLIKIILHLLISAILAFSESSSAVFEDTNGSEFGTSSTRNYATGPECDRFKCFSSLSCELTITRQLTYYIYPAMNISDENLELVYDTRAMISEEYWTILDSIMSSSRYTLDPEKACLFIPPIDITTLSHLNISNLQKLFSKLPHWNSVDGMPGTNHMVISISPSFRPSRIIPAIGRSILVATNHDTWSLRPQFDLNIPVVTGNSEKVDLEAIEGEWDLIFAQFSSIGPRTRQAIEKLETSMKGRLLVLKSACSTVDELKRSRGLNFHTSATGRCSKNREQYMNFPRALASSRFCLILHLNNVPLDDSSHYLLNESLRYGCLPVISSDFILPFENSLNWNRLIISLTNSEDFSNVPKLISQVTSTEYKRRKKLALIMWQEYFSNYSQVTNHILSHYDTFVYPKLLLNQQDEL